MRWTDKDTEFLVKNYKKMPYKQIAMELGFSKATITSKLKNLGVSKKRENKEPIVVVSLQERARRKGQLWAILHQEESLC